MWIFEPRSDLVCQDPHKHAKPFTPKARAFEARSPSLDQSFRVRRIFQEVSEPSNALAALGR